MKHLSSSNVRRNFVLLALVSAASFLLTTAAPAAAAAQEAARPAAAGATSASASSASSAPKPDKALRIFLKTGSKKTYVRGYQWMALGLTRKISLVESARRGALQMDAVMTLPAERYVAEVDKFFLNNPSMFQMEVGQVIQGIAISLKDWEQGGTR